MLVPLSLGMEDPLHALLRRQWKNVENSPLGGHVLHKTTAAVHFHVIESTSMGVTNHDVETDHRKDRNHRFVGVERDGTGCGGNRTSY